MIIEIIYKIYEYIKNNKVLLAICGTLVVIILILLFSISKLSNGRKIDKHNIDVFTEKIHELETKNGDLLVEMDSYITSLNEIEDYLNISKKEVKDLQKVLNDKIIYISDLEAAIKVRSNEVHDTTVVYKDSIYKFAFKFGDQWYDINGRFGIDGSHAKTYLDNFSVSVPLKVGLTEDWAIFVTTSNPYVVFTSMEGALLDKNIYLKETKKRRFCIGLNVGVGAQYGLFYRHFDFGPTVSVGLNYNF